MQELQVKVIELARVEAFGINTRRYLWSPVLGLLIEQEKFKMRDRLDWYHVRSKVIEGDPVERDLCALRVAVCWADERESQIALIERDLESQAEEI